ncbi:MAG: M28 family peptidase [Bacteroidetes bacterium]|nr:M28 family peptidase [Bacteroidota bacterium]
MKLKIYILLFFIAIFLSCNTKTNEGENTEDEEEYSNEALNSVNFNADSAYSYIQKQVDFGPRVPNSQAHKNCGNWLTQMLKKWCDTIYVQEFQAKSYKNDTWNGKNIIGTINPKAKNRLLLCAHWDTRPWADEDTINPNTPADGANDGGSGVGILLELARQFHIKRPEIGIDIIFFDLEDGGQSSESEIEGTWCLGSQYWAKHLHFPEYRANKGILLDMVGGQNATFAHEDMSVKFDMEFLGVVWQTAASLGFGNFFINYSKSGITDDHVYVSFIAKIPTIDIIEYNPRTKTGFSSSWHTHNDNMKIIDKNTLTAVGKTVIYVSYNFAKLTSYQN